MKETKARGVNKMFKFVIFSPTRRPRYSFIQVETVTREEARDKAAQILQDTSIKSVMILEELELVKRQVQVTSTNLKS